MDKLHCEAVDNLFKAVLSLENTEECYAFFEDICTVKEIFDIAQRLEVAFLLKEGKNYLTISRETGASTATISRVNKSVSYGNGGYETVLGRIKGEKKDD